MAGGEQRIPQGDSFRSVSFTWNCTTLIKCELYLNQMSMKKIYRSKMLASVIFLLLSVTAFAQKQIVKGKVTDPNKDPLPGVNIIVKNSTVGTTTDAQGNFSLEAGPDDILVF